VHERCDLQGEPALALVDGLALRRAQAADLSHGQEGEAQEELLQVGVGLHHPDRPGPYPGVGHHPHGLDDPAPVVKFILDRLDRPGGGDAAADAAGDRRGLLLEYRFEGPFLGLYDKQSHSFVNGSWDVTEPDYPSAGGMGDWSARWLHN